MHAKPENMRRIQGPLCAYSGVVAVPVNSEQKPRLFRQVFVLVASMASISLQRTIVPVAVAGALDVHTAQLASLGQVLSRARRTGTVKIVRSERALK